MGALGPVRVPVGAGSLGGTISLGTMGLAWFPDLGRTYPSHRRGPDASIVQTGKLRSVVAERSLQAHFCCAHLGGRGPVPVLSAGCSRRDPVLQSLHYDVHLVLVNKNIPDMGAGELEASAGKARRAGRPLFLCGLPPPCRVSRPGFQGGLRKDTCAAGWAGRGRCVPEVGSGPCSAACFQPDVAF